MKPIPGTKLRGRVFVAYIGLALPRAYNRLGIERHEVDG